MKTSKVADMLGVDQKTVLNWTERQEFSEFFSDDAKGTGRSMGHDYSEAEIITLNTIRTERQKNTGWDDIARMLRSGIRDTELPASALLVSSPAPIVQYGKMQQLQTQIEMLERENTQLREDLRKVREELEEKHRAKEEKLTQEHRAQETEIRDKYERLLREVGRLEGKIESMRTKRDGSDNDE